MAGSCQCNDRLCFSILCDRYDHSLYLCEIPAYGRTAGGFKYIKTSGDRFDRNIRDHNLYTGSVSRKYGGMESYQLAAGRDFSFVYVFTDRKKERPDCGDGTCRFDPCRWQFDHWSIKFTILIYFSIFSLYNKR